MIACLTASGWPILQADLSAEPKVADDGTLWTPGAVDFFRIVNTQVPRPAVMNLNTHQQGCGPDRRAAAALQETAAALPVIGSLLQGTWHLVRTDNKLGRQS